jgi:5,10-methylenetetrahydromethanopterin reductase
VPVSTGIWFFPDSPGAGIVDTITAAEEAGVGAVWLGDEGPARDPFALLAAAARSTSRIRLGVGVTNPYLRHPATTAASAITVHELSGGRMILGIGPGGDLALGPAQVARVRPLEATRRAVRIIRAVSRGEPTEGYTPMEHAIQAPDLPVYVGARSEGFNRFASESADGVLLGGIPRSQLAPTLAWARSVRDIDAALFVNAVFDNDWRERVRPQMIWPILDAPESTRSRLGVTLADVQRAAAALADGDEGPARKVVDDGVLDDMVLAGDPEVVGRRLADELGPLRPTSVGIALLTDDPLAALEPVAVALAVAARRIG